MNTTRFKKFQQFPKPSYEEMEKLNQQWESNTDYSMAGALFTQSEFLRMYGWNRSSFFTEQSSK